MLPGLKKLECVCLHVFLSINQEDYFWTFKLHFQHLALSQLTCSSLKPHPLHHEVVLRGERYRNPFNLPLRILYLDCR